MTLNSIFDFIKEFVGWRETEKPLNFRVLSRHQHKDGLLLRVSRESVTNKINIAETSTYVWLPSDKTKPYLYVFLDSLAGLGIRNLSHRIQVLSSDRELKNNSVDIHIHLSESYWLGNDLQANAVILKLISYCHGRDYYACAWNWEIDAIRSQMMGYFYTQKTQTEAREDNSRILDKFDTRFPFPLKISATLINKFTNSIVKPLKAPRKSIALELLIIGGSLIGIVWLLVNR